MSNNSNPSPNASESHSLSNNDLNPTLFQDMEKNGLEYINHQKNYLIFTAIFPIYAIFVQVFNLINILTRNPIIPPDQPPLPLIRPENLYDVITPIIIFIIISAFAILQFIFLHMWMKKAYHYENQRKSASDLASNEEEHDFVKETVSLSQLFYDIIDHMQKIRIIFILLNIAFIFYFQWTFGFLLNFFGVISNPRPAPGGLFHILNIISEFGLLFYMIFEWKHFLKWNKKLKRIDQLEKKIYEELEI